MKPVCFTSENDSPGDRLLQKIDLMREVLERRFDRVDQSFRALSAKIELGFARYQRHSALTEHVGALELDIVRLQESERSWSHVQRMRSSS